MSFEEIESMGHKKKQNKMEQDFSAIVAERIPQQVELAKVAFSPQNQELRLHI